MTRAVHICWGLPKVAGDYLALGPKSPAPEFVRVKSRSDGKGLAVSGSGWSRAMSSLPPGWRFSEPLIISHNIVVGKANVSSEESRIKAIQAETVKRLLAEKKRVLAHEIPSVKVPVAGKAFVLEPEVKKPLPPKLVDVYRKSQDEKRLARNASGWAG